jgi:hypothetical protein
VEKHDVEVSRCVLSDAAVEALASFAIDCAKRVATVSDEPMVRGDGRPLRPKKGIPVKPRA